MFTREKPHETEEAGRRNGIAFHDQPDWAWADPKTLGVKPEFQRLIPLQSREEFRALQASILCEGCRDPLHVWKGHDVILDGHTRWELCKGHNLRVKVREIDLPDDKAASAYILQLQRQRRNLTREALSYFRGAEYNAVKGQRGGRRPRRKSKGKSYPLPTTAEKLALDYGVSSKTIKTDGRFAAAIDRIAAEHGDLEIKRKLLGADVKLTQRTAWALLKMPADERKKVVDELVEYGELPRGKKEGGPSRRPKEMARAIYARLEKKGEVYARSVLHQLAKWLGMEVVEKAAVT
jgi:ParB-like chromosome segregation protein Spo0J